MEPLICKCCGGKIDPDTMVCMYCDTPHSTKSPAAGLRTHIQPVGDGIYTPNEMRVLLGLGTIEEKNNILKSQLAVENLYNAALKSLRDYEGEDY